MVGWRRFRTERNNIMSRFAAPKRVRCRRCPFRAASGRCLSPGRRSGRCGDWVWYMRHGKQWRRLYVKPKDPRTSGQLHWRDRFGAASKKYSHSLTDEQRHACIAVGAKLRSRPRLGQSGPLTGQQYSISRECAPRAQERPRRAEKLQKELQTQGIPPSSSGPHRGVTGVPPGLHHRLTGRTGKGQGRRRNDEGRRQKVGAASEVPKSQRLTRAGRARYRNNFRARRWREPSISGRLPVFRRAGFLVSANLS